MQSTVKPPKYTYERLFKIDAGDGYSLYGSRRSDSKIVLRKGKQIDSENIMWQTSAIVMDDQLGLDLGYCLIDIIGTDGNM
ncbi:MAG: hypothetical protein FWG30_12105 [Eubacteriaceae bacterium]|nr:hypothetical protein [Eubacteriaceae bacterium]